MLSVAQFRRSFFKPTETFIYNYLASFQRIVPVCITFQRENYRQFQLRHPMIVLYRWNIINKIYRRLYHRVCPGDKGLKFDRFKTFYAIKKYAVRVLHAHFGYTGYEILPIKHKSNLPMVTTFYGEDISSLANLEEWQQKYARLFSEGDVFLVEGPNMRTLLLKIGCPAHKAEIQRIALDLRKYPFRSRLPKSKKQSVRVLFCGTFRQKKGLLYALDSARCAHEKYPNFQFRIIGDGELRPDVERFINRYRMNSYTLLLGFQSHARMLEEMHAADIFIHPSITADNGDSEGGAPTTILEAQACGLPVLSSLHADIPNVVVPDKSALLAPERDVESLCGHLSELLREPERWARMGNKGRAFVEKYHDISKEVILLEDRYHKLAGYKVV